MRRQRLVALSGLGPVILILLLTFGASAASADTTYNPSAWNGRIVYMSVACHDGNDGVPGGPCITNTGCDDFSENLNSKLTAHVATRGTGTRQNLIQPGYRVIVGDGTLNENVTHSNAAGASVHFPVHSNASGSGACPGLAKASAGTRGLYKPDRPASKNCASIIVGRIGYLSPAPATRSLPATISASSTIRRAGLATRNSSSIPGRPASTG
jgi:hypothetical protein